MWPRRATGKHWGSIRLHRHNFYPRLAPLEHLTDSRNGPTGANARDDKVNLAIRISPNFFGGRLAVRRGVSRIGELLQNNSSRDFCGQLFGFGNRPLHSLGPLRENKPSAEDFEQLATLATHCLRHGQDELEPLGGRHKG